MKKFALLIGTAVLLAAQASLAQTSPVGLWKSVDDATGRVKSHVRISEKAGELVGVVEKTFPLEGADKNPICTACPDARKDKPIIGMQIMGGYKAEEGNTGKYIEGNIIDPENGKIYKSFIQLKEGGKKLDVRGFIGAAFLGRTQTWQRAE
jgi:uncharacterized protein (DUF2147 family)